MIAPLVAALTLTLAPPPSPATWPAYPSFAQHSCWTRHPFPGRPLQFAPSYAPPRRAKPVPAKVVLARLLARFGDRSFVTAVRLGRPPRITLTHLKGYYGGKRPPKDALWAYITAPAAAEPASATPAPEDVVRFNRAEWEAGLVGGALRDELCNAGGAPLVGWSLNGVTSEISDHGQAQGQRFPNPPAAVFEAHVAATAAQFGATVASVQLLRPLGLAPVVVLQTSEDRKTFAKRVPDLVRALDLIAQGKRGAAFLFEGFFFEAVDAAGAPFVTTERIERGQAMGGEWAWDPCYLPFPHSTPVGAPPCP